MSVRLTTLPWKKPIVTKTRTEPRKTTDKYNDDGHLLWTRKRNKNKNKNNNDIKMGTWNVRTMLILGKMQEIANELNKCEYSIVALQETRWAAQGEIKKKEFTVCYSGSEKRTGQKGVAFMVMGKIRKNV